MKSTIFIPKDIVVGFNKRSGTFTGALAYIIYHDQTGKLRKQLSWDNWRDKSIDSQEFDNKPTEGFILNKTSDSHYSRWGSRETHIRVYDPRGFEFEITPKNLMYILEHTSSIKGKGLDGKFVYGWDNTDLVLLPIDTPDYKEVKEHSEIISANKKIGVKDLVIGGTYITKNKVEHVYLGRHDFWDYHGVEVRKRHIFGRLYKDEKEEEFLSLTDVASPSGRFIDIVSNDKSPKFETIMELLDHSIRISPIDYSKSTYTPLTEDELLEKLNTPSSSKRFYIDEVEYIIDPDFYNRRLNENNIFEIKKTSGRSRGLADLPVNKGTLKELLEDNIICNRTLYLVNGNKY